MRKNIGMLQLTVLLAVILSSTVTMVYALTILWSAQVSVNIVDTVQLGVYSDSACTTVVQSIAFGDQKKGASASITLFIKNTGTTNITLGYSSNAPTSILAGDDWVWNNGGTWANIKGYVLKTNQVLETKYQIYILPNAPTGSKTWTLSLGSA